MPVPSPLSTEQLLSFKPVSNVTTSAKPRLNPPEWSSAATVSIILWALRNLESFSVICLRCLPPAPPSISLMTERVHFVPLFSELRILALHITYTQHKIHSMFVFMSMKELMKKQVTCEKPHLWSCCQRIWSYLSHPRLDDPRMALLWCCTHSIFQHNSIME